VNQLLLEMNEESMFVTVFYGILDSREGLLEYARAGHESPVLFDDGGSHFIPEMKPGQPLGIFRNPLIDTGSLKIPGKSLLLLYTDGVLDATSPKGVFFGLEGLLDLGKANPGLGGQEFCQVILDAIRGHQSTAAQMDDITVVAVHANGGV
jgi:serine phosphatase RsbU (regulator of sigma subunit)